MVSGADLTLMMNILYMIRKGWKSNKVERKWKGGKDVVEGKSSWIAQMVALAIPAEIVSKVC